VKAGKRTRKGRFPGGPVPSTRLGYMPGRHRPRRLPGLRFPTKAPPVPVGPGLRETIMCYFDSPIGRCEAVKEMVLMDQTQGQCAREHHCPAGRTCPLAGCFTTCSGLYEEEDGVMPPAKGGTVSATRAH